MIINPDTKIASLLKEHAEALEAIVSISPKFTKLRNPVLRKLIAGRTSIAMASQIGGCSIDDFFNKLQPLGFEMDNDLVTGIDVEKNPGSQFRANVQTEKIVELDVRPVIHSGKDPLTFIIQKVKALETGDVLKIINRFEPVPLMNLLGKQGFESYSEVVDDGMVHTFFYKNEDKKTGLKNNKTADSESWQEIVEHFNGKLNYIDVRELEMSIPMLTILEALEYLPVDKALLVDHKRIPVFLLPELEERKFSYRIKEVSDGEVQLLIYKA